MAKWTWHRVRRQRSAKSEALRYSLKGSGATGKDAALEAGGDEKTGLFLEPLEAAWSPQIMGQ